MQKLEYMVLVAEGNKARIELEIIVTKAIAEGWQPQGGVSVSETSLSGYGYITYAQAMTRGTSQEELKK